MSSTLRNPIPMGTAAAAGQITPPMAMTMAQAYGSRGGRRSAARRAAKRGVRAVVKRAKKRGAGKLKFGSPAYRAKYLGKGKRKRK